MYRIHSPDISAELRRRRGKYELGVGRIAQHFGFSASDLRGTGKRGRHGDKALANARAAACWWLFRQGRGLTWCAMVVGLSIPGTRQAIQRAKSRLTEAELEAARAAAEGGA